MTHCGLALDSVALLNFVPRRVKVKDPAPRRPWRLLVRPVLRSGFGQLRAVVKNSLSLMSDAMSTVAANMAFS